MIECLNLALTDREAYDGDPDFTDVPMDALLSPKVAAARAALIRDDAAFGKLLPQAFQARNPRDRLLAALPMARCQMFHPG